MRLDKANRCAACTKYQKKLKDMGYSEVQLIDTANGKFMTRSEALRMEFSGSTLLVGRK